MPAPVDVELRDDQSGRAHPPEFAPTQIDENLDAAVDWWSESTDGQCSENASLFAESQSAPLNVV